MIYDSYIIKELIMSWNAAKRGYGSGKYIKNYFKKIRRQDNKKAIKEI